MSRRASLTRGRSGGVRVETTYSAAFVAAIKERVPTGARRWDPSIRCWVVNEHWFDDVEALCKEHFEELYVDGVRDYFHGLGVR